MKAAELTLAQQGSDQNQTMSMPSLKAAVAIATLSVAASPAFAQISKLNTVMGKVQAALVGVALIIFTIAIMWAGFKMAFQHAKWSEVSNIVIGGILVGGAAGLAAWLIN